jgi:hypothetical protein
VTSTSLQIIDGMALNEILKITQKNTSKPGEYKHKA